jgi:uncharacterized surface protein with fasciclin (FAS1) repeats
MCALEKANLTYLLKERGPYTVFMPVQASFVEFRSDYNIKHIDQMPEDELAEILLYHFISGNWMISDIPAGYHPTLTLERTTGNPIVLFVEKNGVFRLNGINTLDEPDLHSTNGFIQSIKTVLKIPTVLDHLSVNEDFSLIFEIISRKDLDPELVSLISGNGPFTLLVPTNKAILSYIESNHDWQTIDDIPGPILSDILVNHLVQSKNIVLDKQKEDLNFSTMNKNNITIQVDFPKWSIMDEHKRLAYINIRDIQGVNGVIHQIDRVLLP